MRIYALDSNIISAMLKDDERIINRYENEAVQGREL